MMKIRIIQNTFILFLSIFSFSSFAQGTSKQELKKGWHLLDKEKDGVYGISLDKAYDFLRLKNLKSKPVLVAVIDSGVDTAQEDLIHILWTNPGEIPGNGIDDDHNGYVDDVHGWDFLGGPGGKCDYTETTEEIREYNRLKDKYATATTAPAGGEKEYAYWLQVKATHDETVGKSTAEIAQ